MFNAEKERIMISDIVSFMGVWDAIYQNFDVTYSLDKWVAFLHIIKQQQVLAPWFNVQLMQTNHQQTVVNDGTKPFTSKCSHTT